MTVSGYSGIPLSPIWCYHLKSQGCLIKGYLLGFGPCSGCHSNTEVSSATSRGANIQDTSNKQIWRAFRAQLLSCWHSPSSLPPLVSVPWLPIHSEKQDGIKGNMTSWKVWNLEFSNQGWFPVRLAYLSAGSSQPSGFPPTSQPSAAPCTQ